MFAALLLFQASASSWPVASLKVQGLSRFAEKDVAAASGLKVNAPAGVADLDEACKRLTKTGLFQSCKYRSSAASQGAIDVELTVGEMAAAQRVRFTIPGVDEKQLWAWLQKNEPLVQDHVPANDDALEFYTAAVRRFLKAEGRHADVVSAVESDLRAREQTFIFRPKNLPPIVDVAFSGESAIPEQQLRNALLPVAKGTGFTEFDVRRLVDSNVRPLFENEGRLRVEFPSVRTDKVSDGVRVTVAVNQGPVFKLRTVKVAGELKAEGLFPIGEIANWSKVEAGAEQLKQGLRNQGYLNASYSIARELNDDTTADATLTFKRGPLFTFGKLLLEGLDGVVEQRVRSRWKLREGEPMNDGYVSEFLKSVKDDLPKRITGLSVDLAVRPQSTVADVRIKFGS